MESYQNYEMINFKDISDNITIEEILHWRNDDSIRMMMYNTNLITTDEHLSFIRNLKNSNDRLYFLIKRKGVGIGVFNLININKNKEAELGHYLAPAYQNSDLGVESYYAILTHCFEVVKMDSIYGYFLVSNKNILGLCKLFHITIGNIVEINGKSYCHGFITKDIWKEKIKKDQKIQRLLKLTL